MQDTLFLYACSCGQCLDCIHIQAQMGLQNLRIIGSGGAPLASQTQDFIAHVLAPVAQGYGATETTGCLSVRSWDPGNLAWQVHRKIIRKSSETLLDMFRPFLGHKLRGIIPELFQSILVL